MNVRSEPAPTTVATFHLDCVDHLCHLENELQEVRLAAGEGPNLAKLDTIRRILANVSEFAECRFTEPAFNNLAGRIHKLYERTKPVEQMLRDESWGSLRRIFGKRPNDERKARLQRTCEQLNKDIDFFLVEYFVSCVKRFHTPHSDKQVFLESVDAFISEIDRVWN